MTDSIEKISAEMDDAIIAVAKGETRYPAVSINQIKDWKERIEALMKTPVATLCLGCGETLESLAYRREHGDMRPCCPDSRQDDVYLLPPDQSKRIAELEKELAEVKHYAERYRYLRTNWDKWSGISWKFNTEGMLNMNIDIAISQEKDNDK